MSGNEKLVELSAAETELVTGGGVLLSDGVLVGDRSGVLVGDRSGVLMSDGVTPGEVHTPG